MSEKNMTYIDIEHCGVLIREYKIETRENGLLKNISYMYQPPGFINKFKTLKQSQDAYDAKIDSTDGSPS